MEVTNRFKGLDGIDKVPEKLWMEVCNTVYRRKWSNHPQEKEAQEGLKIEFYNLKHQTYTVLMILKFVYFYSLNTVSAWAWITFWGDEIVSRRKNIILKEKVKVLVAQWCLTLWNPMYCSPPGSSVQGILQARMLEWVTIPFSRGSCQPRDWTWVSYIAGRFFTVWATREAL